MRKPSVECDFCLSKGKTVVEIQRTDGRQLSIMDVIAALNALAVDLSLEVQLRMAERRPEFMWVDEDGIVSEPVPFFTSPNEEN